jgi:hypothetical protein
MVRTIKQPHKRGKTYVHPRKTHILGMPRDEFKGAVGLTLLMFTFNIGSGILKAEGLV